MRCPNARYGAACIKPAHHGAMVMRNGGRGGHRFYRVEGVLFSPEALGAAPSVKMVLGGWFRDRDGFPTRRLAAIEARARDARR
jgi:hypothetical protein